MDRNDMYGMHICSAENTQTVLGHMRYACSSQHTRMVNHGMSQSVHHTSKRSTKNRQDGQRFQFSVLANA